MVLQPKPNCKATIQTSLLRRYFRHLTPLSRPNGYRLSLISNSETPILAGQNMERSTMLLDICYSFISVAATAPTCSVKLNSTGSSLPLGSLVPGSRNSSKNVCAQACSAHSDTQTTQSNAHLQRRDPGGRRVLQEAGHQVYRLRRGSGPEDLDRELYTGRRKLSLSVRGIGE